jgi:DNA excision repair protein ERCC-4
VVGLIIAFTSLLTQFDGEKTLSLYNGQHVPADIPPNHVASKLIMLTLHFPTLRLLWSKDTDTTVKLICALKAKHAEPDPVAAAAVVADGESEGGALVRSSSTSSALSAGDARDLTLQDFLLKLPGISSANLRRVLARISCLADLAAFSVAELEELLGPASGKRLHGFLHARFGAPN